MLASRPRTAAQIEASRRNGALSRGPVTREGKARASRNAVRHGLTAMTHLVLEGEDARELEELTFRMMVETGVVSELEARIARRLAIAFWKGERAERMEVALLNAAPKLRPPAHGNQGEPADPLTTFDVKRFNAIRGAQAQIGREISRCLKELRQLRKDALMECTDEPEAAGSSDFCTNEWSPGTGEPGPPWEIEPGSVVRNEPEDPPPPANDDAASQTAAAAAIGAQAPRNKPEPAAAPSSAPAVEPERDEPERPFNRQQRRALAAMQRQARRRAA